LSLIGASAGMKHNQSVTSVFDSSAAKTSKVATHRTIQARKKVGSNVTFSTLTAIKGSHTKSKSKGAISGAPHPAAAVTTAS